MIGRTVSHFEIREALGGTMGRVFKAWDLRNECWRVLKFLAPEFADDEVALARLQREAQAAASLEHGHICTIYKMDRDEDGQWFIVMAYYEGRTLAECLRDGPLKPADAVDYARQIALGLAAAHRHGIVHRDIKPANVMITADGEAVILDFGIAALSHGPRLTKTGHQPGTLVYMAPELCRGSEPQPAADIWSVGVLFYEMLTGELPFQAAYPAAYLHAITHEDPLPLPGRVGPARAVCQGILDRCLARNPRARYATAAELATNLAAAGHAEAVGTGHRRLRRPPRWGRRLVATLAAVALVLVGGLAAIAIYGGGIGEEARGAAVLPFKLESGNEADRALGEGLGWYVGDLLATETAGRKHWVAPPDDVVLYGIDDRVEATDILGVAGTVAAFGTTRGGILELRVEIVPAPATAPVTRTFRNEITNLRTWQTDLTAWCLAQLDPGLQTPAAASRRGTRVPQAFRHYLEGIGWERRYVDADPQRRQDNLDRALAAFGSAVGRDSSFACARAEYGYALWVRYAATDPERAAEGVARVRQALDLEPGHARATLYLARITEAMGDDATTREAFARAETVAPGSAEALLGQVRLGLAAGDSVGAERALHRLEAARRGYAVTQLALGKVFYGARNAERTIGAWRRATELAPRCPHAQNYLGVALFEFEDDPEAEACFLKAIALSPSAHMFENLGTWYYYHDSYDDAKVQYRKALALATGNQYQMWRNLAESYRWTASPRDSVRTAYARARRIAETLLRDDPGNLRLQAELATFCSFLGDTARTLGLLAGLTVEDLDSNSLFLVAVAWEDIGERERALDYLGRALDSGQAPTLIEKYPGLRNLRADARYVALMAQHRTESGS